MQIDRTQSHRRQGRHELKVNEEHPVTCNPSRSLSVIRPLFTSAWNPPSDEMVKFGISSSVYSTAGVDRAIHAWISSMAFAG